MKIALWGYGKMGVVIETLGLAKGYEFPIKATSKDDLKLFDYSEVDAIIEFTQPEAAISNIKLALELGVPIVVGTTGWYDSIPEIERLTQDKGGKVLYASNFSIGVNLFFKLNEMLANWMDNYPEYKATLTETHHTEKLDAPSGTAITLAEGLLENNKHYAAWKLRENFQEDNNLSVIAVREPNVPGTHEIKYASEIDEITIEHKAYNRNGFASGSIFAAEWLSKSAPGFYSIKDAIKL